MTSEIAIKIDEASKSFGNELALDTVSLCIKAGTATAFLGPNGAGKTTLLQMIMGSISCDSGRITVFGQSPGSIGVRLRSGAMLQMTGVPATLTVKEHINLFRCYYLDPMDYQHVIHLANLKGLEHRKYGTLSGGEKQRLHFALAIAGNPDLLFLDEPTTAMDIETRRSLWNQISEFAHKECTVVLNTHNLDEAESLADRIVLLDQGRIVIDATPKKIRSMVGTSVVTVVTEISADKLKQLPGVLDVQLLSKRATLVVNNPEQTVRALFNLDSKLSGLEVRRARLQDAYIHLLSQDSSSS